MLVAEPLRLGRRNPVEVVIGGHGVLLLVLEGLIGWQFGDDLFVIILVAAAGREGGCVFGHSVDSWYGGVSLLRRSAAHQLRVQSDINQYRNQILVRQQLI